MPIFRHKKLKNGLFLVDESGLAPESYGLRPGFLHTYSAFKLTPLLRRTGGRGRTPLNTVPPRAAKRRGKFAV